MDSKLDDRKNVMQNIKPIMFLKVLKGRMKCPKKGLRDIEKN